MLKNLSLIIIICILAYSQVGYYFVMRHHQHEQKEAVKEKIFRQLKDEEFQVISLADHQNIYWEEDEREFLLNGEMYDVVKRTTINGKEVLYCINDKKEKALIDNYNLVTKHNSASDKKGKNAFDNSFNLFVEIDNNSELNFGSPANIFYSFDSHLLECIANELSPPPKA
ncbi:MAG TPA: hypothetical protein VMY77_03885 [Chitinophagaceae bacterium]|nr:hypothetical protein [Chitinophagaceae bacterium]